MVDGWIGDDWFHNGAFRQPSFDYILQQTAKKGSGPVPYGTGDDYDVYLAAGSAGNVAKLFGLEQFPAARKLMEHPDYDVFWQEQAVDKLLGKRPLTVPTMLTVGQWDQEDSYGAPAVYKALEAKDTGNTQLSLVIGPWRHCGVGADGSKLGAIDFAGDTALGFRKTVMKPFLDQYLKDGAPKAATPPVMTYATGVNEWQQTQRWPAGKAVPLYLRENQGLAFTPPAAAGRDSYVSDPAKPVPFVPRPVHLRERDVWTSWLVADQRFVDGRPDVVTFSGPVLDKPVHIAGAPLVDLWAATSGTDSDWVVKLIDVYPAENSANPKMAGYQLPVGIEIFRGRYQKGFSKPAPLAPGKPLNYKFELPNVNHVFKPGHRIMVQVQSSLFPLYDRNPQSYVPNIFWAKPEDYKVATQSIVHAPGQASAIWLPIVADGQ
jgi:putative CocE/NonD family hydrolase